MHLAVVGRDRLAVQQWRLWKWQWRLWQWRLFKGNGVFGIGACSDDELMSAVSLDEAFSEAAFPASSQKRGSFFLTKEINKFSVRIRNAILRKAALSHIWAPVQALHPAIQQGPWNHPAIQQGPWNHL